jgi:AcrR family transcriptional regulator
MAIAEAGRGRGRPVTVEREQLLAAALDLGPDNLALRDIAEALGVPRTTIYYHVRSPTELGGLVLSALLAAGRRAPGNCAEDETWQTQLELFAVRQRNGLLAAGAWLRYYDPAIHIGPETLREADQLIGLLVEVGFPVEEAGHALGLITAVINESVAAQGRNLDRSASQAQYLLHLSADEFPWIAAARGVGDPDREEEQFRYSLARAIDGISSSLRRPSNGPPPPRRPTRS